MWRQTWILAASALSSKAAVDASAGFGEPHLLSFWGSERPGGGGLGPNNSQGQRSASASVGSTHPASLRLERSPTRTKQRHPH